MLIFLFLTSARRVISLPWSSAEAYLQALSTRLKMICSTAVMSMFRASSDELSEKTVLTNMLSSWARSFRRGSMR